MKKIQVIKGDVTTENLGLDTSDQLELIENVHLIFNMAANVRFDLSLKEATNFNVRGTLRVLQLAEKMKNLQVFTHISTAYCNCNEAVLEEKYYKSMENPYGVMQMTELLSDETLKIVTPKLLGKLPNTYSYTKGLAEDLVHSFRHKFSIVIARPSIVVASWKEPLPGFVEGVNGPTGLMIAAGKGVVRSMHCHQENPCESVPVDVNINCMIALAYKKSLMDSNEVLFCNITDSGIRGVTWGECLESGRKILLDYPMSIALWYPEGSMKSNYFLHMLCVFFFHYLPAYFIDFILFITGNKPFLVNVQHRISHGLRVLQYYTTRKWFFKNDNFRELYESLSEFDKEKFYFDLREIEIQEFLKSYMMGIRTFILKEKDEDLPKARATLKR